MENLDISSFSLTKGNCRDLDYVEYVPHMSIGSNTNQEFVILIDSISTTDTYYIDWEFNYFSGSIQDFTWKLELDSMYKVGVETIENDFVKINKNPSNGIFEVSIASFSQNVEINIYNIAGNAVYKKKLQNITTRIPVNISNSPAGIYMVSISVGQKVYKEKILIIH